MITKTEALSFLKEHQPMPKDNLLTKEVIEKYEEVRVFFLNNPAEECIPLFLNSFGGKDGLGVYQMVEDVIMMYDKEVVLQYILNTFDSLYVSVKYWCVQISSGFPDASLFCPLVKLLQSEDVDIKTATVTVLAQLALNDIYTNDVIKVLEDEVKTIYDEEIKAFVKDVLLDIRNSI